MVQSQPFIDSLNVTKKLEQKLAEIEPSLAISGITLHYDLFRPANFINEALSNIQKDVLIGAFLVLIVLFFSYLIKMCSYLCYRNTSFTFILYYYSGKSRPDIKHNGFRRACNCAWRGSG